MRVGLFTDLTKGQIGSVRDSLEAFLFHSVHDFWIAQGNRNGSPAFANQGLAKPDLHGLDCVVAHHSLRICKPDLLLDGLAESFRSFSGLRVALIQDDYTYTARVREWIQQAEVDVVFTVVPEEGIAKVYPPEDFADVRFENTLTGYVAPWMEQSSAQGPPIADRECRICYRGSDLPYWYGKLGREKGRIGRRFREACDSRQVPVDIEWDLEKRIWGDAWKRFLRKGRATLGTESGSNVFDEEGEIEAGIRDALEANEGLTFEEAGQRFIQEENIGIKMNQISPKLFEFAACKTALILMEGEYSGLLEPWTHYLPLRPDYSNLEDLLCRLEETDTLQAMADRAWDHLIGSGDYTYRRFVGRVDRILSEEFESRGKQRSDGEFRFGLQMLDAASLMWQSSSDVEARYRERKKKDGEKVADLRDRLSRCREKLELERTSRRKKPGRWRWWKKP